jgi:ubiquinone/menaquinone biosynthesis C-methylase UbiE
MNSPHDRRYNRGVERLRDPERVARLEVPQVVRHALQGLDQPRAVLDVGTGTGLFAEEFARRGLAVTGMDANPDMLPVARQFVPAADFQDGTAEALPFEDGSFDLVFMGLLLHETDDISAALAEAYRVTRRRLAVLEWLKEEQAFGPPSDHRLDPEEVVSLSKRTGFLNIEILPLTHLVLYRMDR